MSVAFGLRRNRLTLLAGVAALAVASPAWADATPDCNDGASAGSTECGTNSTTGRVT
ncbi:MAG: hypothetical protein IPO50_05235 [Sphingomonadales bacterium]|nr:hypothetical protein [Sphingomonadales bacterium]